MEASPPALGTASLALCQHCGSEVPHSMALRGERFCCAGCESVNAYLNGNGLEGVYERFRRVGQSMPVARAAKAAPPPERYDDPAFLARTRDADGTYRLHVPALRCSACLWFVESALLRVDGVKDVRAQLLDFTVVVRLQEGASLVPVVLWLTKMGYQPYPGPPADEGNTERLRRRERLRDVGIAGVLFANAMIYAAALYVGKDRGMGEATAEAFRWLSLAVTIPALVFPGRAFFLNAWKGLRAGALHYDLPIAVSLALAFVVSLRSCFAGNGEVYFDSITGLVFLLGAGRALNESLLASARRLVGGGVGLLPERAGEARVNETMDVVAGEAFPADGTIVEGNTDADESALTGESRPVSKGVGSHVLAGTLNLSGVVRVRVERVLDDTVLAGLQRAAAEAFRDRTRFERFADRALKPFVLAVIAIACIGGAAWAWIDVDQVVPITLALFIVGCPCALALSTPLASAIAMQRAWRAGAVAKTPDAFERLARVDTVVFDKTGTLTRGEPRVVSHTNCGSDAEFVEIVRALAETSRHPFSRAIVRHLVDARGAIVARVSEGRGALAGAWLEEVPGCGLRALFGDGKTVWLGSPEGIAQRLPLSFLVQEACVNARVLQDGLSVVIATDGRRAEVFSLDDELKPCVAETVARLTAQGMRVQILSGDTRGAVERVALAGGIPCNEAFAGLSPVEKSRHVAALQDAGGCVLMVGDGINDAIALAKADVGVTLDEGLDTARASALVHLRGKGLSLLPSLLSFSRKTNTTMWIVLCTSASYNAVALGLTLFGFVHPLVAALIMPLSSVTTMAIATLRNGGSGPWRSP